MSLTDALPDLRRPWPAHAVRLKPQTVVDDKRALVAYYLDARLVASRLNAVVGPDGWADSYRLLCSERAVEWGVPVECQLTVLGVTRADVGQVAPGELNENTWKSAYSDALKRAAVKFGVGAYLYSVPRVWVEVEVDRRGKVRGFSREGVAAARSHYERWLASDEARRLYGEPLDHGDAADESDYVDPAGGDDRPGFSQRPQGGSQTAAEGDSTVPEDEAEHRLRRVRLIAAELGITEEVDRGVASHRRKHDGAILEAWLSELERRAREAAEERGVSVCEECGGVQGRHQEGCIHEIPF